jgi:arylsulfatase A
VREKARSAKADARLAGHVTNGPWHDGKGTPYEGGHRVPFIARWPGRIAPGSVSEETLCLTDLLATVAELVGATLPADAGEDSFSLLPVLLGSRPTGPVRTHTFILGDAKNLTMAVRSGSWKLIEARDSGGRKVYHLHDLSADPGETSDLAKDRPEVVTELAAALEQARNAGRTRD